MSASSPIHRGRTLWVALLTFALLVGLGPSSLAIWTEGSVAGGSGAATGSVLGAGSIPTPVLAERTVELSWAPSILTSGQAATGYLVKRYHADTGVLQTLLTACTGTVATTSCTEANVPEGRWVYTVTPRIGDSWLGAESGVSTVVLPLGTGPSGGSVDAVGLKGTGTRYSTTTSLSIALATGTDASGLATTGNLLRRASAPLAAGTCGTFTGFSLVATDPVSPWATTVSDQTCYRYEYVVADAQGNATTYTSGDIKVDTSAPTIPTLTFSGLTNAYWPGTGSTVFYRAGGASGALTVTAASTDTGSGIASYKFPSLPTSWVPTDISTGVRTYTWGSTVVDPGARTVTATNGAGRTSNSAGLTLTEDSTAPSAGTVTYPTGMTTNSIVSVGFTTGTDAGSGIATRVLQRAQAPVISGVCSTTWSAFVTVTVGTDPASSPVVDIVGASTCYRYRYVVTDRLGNEHVATNAATVQVAGQYATTVAATTGLVSYYQMSRGADLVKDTFTGTAGVTLESRPGEVSATWIPPSWADTSAVLTTTGTVRKGGTSTRGVDYTVPVPATTANYTVSADFVSKSIVANDMIGLMGRVDTSAADTYYLVRYEQSTGIFYLFRLVNGVWTTLGGYPQALTPGTSYRVALSMEGNVIKVSVDGVEHMTYTDATPITGRGQAGATFGGAWNSATNSPFTTTITDTTGLHLDNFQVTSTGSTGLNTTNIVDSVGTNNGTFFNGPLVGQAGALTNGDFATTFDGVNDYGQIARQISDDFSIEFWFRSTQGIGTAPTWYSGAALVDADIPSSRNDFGISLRSDGHVVAGMGNPEMSILSGASGLNNGAWHHVVLTRTMSTGLLTLYVDGVSTATGTGNTLPLNASANISFGKIQSADAHYFAGGLDEVALYSVALTPATIAAHYNAR